MPMFLPFLSVWKWYVCSVYLFNIASFISLEYFLVYKVKQNMSTYIFNALIAFSKYPFSAVFLKLYILFAFACL